MTVKELNEWFAFFDLDKHAENIKAKTMTDDERTEAIKAGFGV